MARQDGNIIIRGSLGNLTFRRTKHGAIVQVKSKLNKEQFMTDPRFKNSRGSSNEFTIAGKGAGTLTRMFGAAIEHCCDNLVQSRLTRRLQKVIYADEVSKKGERNLLMGDIKLLNDFWWNRNVHISTILGVRWKLNVDRETGEVTFHIPSFLPKKALRGGSAPSHYRIIASTAEVDWRESDRVAEMEMTDYLEWNKKVSEPFNPVLKITKGSKVPIVSCLAIRWYVKVAGEMNELRDMRYNTAGIVGVDVL